MQINLQLKKLVRNLLKNEQKIKNINEYLYEIILKWHHPNETIHRDTQLYVMDLKDFFENISSTKEATTIYVDHLNSLFSFCEIENYIDSLHDIMFCYLENSNETGFKPLKKYFNNYKFTRNFLNELKIVEREINIKKGVLVIN